mmetsp:Transcript_68871/g.199792  ORF Transcript_68871/g.199792 Transcript_68871/m.199792 type:complete len:280 (+) Transcript_68871:479-1318(+)
MEHLDEGEHVTEHHALVVIDLRPGLLYGRLGARILRVLLFLFGLHSTDRPPAEREIQHVGEGNETQVAPVPLDRRVVLELQEADLQQPIDVVLHQEGDEDHALRGLERVTLLQGLRQLRDVRQLLPPAVCPPRPRQCGLHLRHGRLPRQQGVVRRHVDHEALQAPAEVLHDAPGLIPGLGLGDELPNVFVQLAGMGPRQMLLEVLQAQHQEHARRAGDQLQGVRARVHRWHESLVVPHQDRRGEETRRHPFFRSDEAPNAPRVAQPGGERAEGEIRQTA